MKTNASIPAKLCTMIKTTKGGHNVSQTNLTWRRVVIFSERELVFTFAICCRPSVCRLSVCRL